MHFERLTCHAYDGERDLPCDQIDESGPDTAVRHLHEVWQVCLISEHFVCQMIGRAHAIMSKMNLVGILLGISCELFQVLRRHRGMNHDPENRHDDARDRVNVLHRIIEWPRLDERFVDMRKRTCRQKCVAVRLSTRHCGRTYRCTTPTDVLDDDRTEKRLHLLRPRPSDKVVCAAGWEWDYEPDLLRRICLRPCNPRHRLQHGCASGQMQKLSARQFRLDHVHAPSRRAVQRRPVKIMNGECAIPADGMRAAKRGLRHVRWGAALLSRYLSLGAMRKGQKMVAPGTFDPPKGVYRAGTPQLGDRTHGQ